MWPFRRRSSSAAPFRRLVVGLGNPGAEYAGTRHNLGFEVVEALAKRLGIGFVDGAGPVRVARLERDGSSDGLVLPCGFMNRSGETLRTFCGAAWPKPDDVLVVVDDTSLDAGAMRFRLSGSSGGHNGLKSLIAAFGSETFPRLRLGVGAAPPGGLIEHVLGRPSEAERLALDAAVIAAAEGVHSWLEAGASGIERWMNDRSSLPASVRGTERPGDAASAAPDAPTAKGGGGGEVGP